MLATSVARENVQKAYSGAAAALMTRVSWTLWAVCEGSVAERSKALV